MIIAETIGKSVEETMQLSVHEIQLWAAHFNIKNKKQNQTMNSAKARRR